MNLLTPDERSQILTVDRFNSGGLFGIDWNHAKAVESGHAGDGLLSGYSAPEKKRLAKAITEYISLYSKRPANANGYGALIIECAQEVRLPLIEVLNIIEGLPKSKKTISSIAEFNEKFAERKERLEYASRERRNIIDTLRKECEETLGCLTEVVDKIRSIIPEFPDPDELNNSWQAIFGVSFGLDPKETLKCNRERMAVYRDGMQDADFWPAVPLYCLHLAGQIPREKRRSAIEFIIELSGDSFVGCDVIAHWQTTVAKAPDFLDGDYLDDDDYYLGDLDPDYFFSKRLDPEHRDEINANWQAKPDAIIPFPKPIRLGATQ